MTEPADRWPQEWTDRAMLAYGAIWEKVGTTPQDHVRAVLTALDEAGALVQVTPEVPDAG